MKTILVTGGGGFIGSNLVAELLARGTHDVVICDHFGSSQKWRNLIKHPVSEIIAPEHLADWLAANGDSLEMVYHFGGISSTTEKDIDLILKHNFTLSLQLWRWCNAKNVRFIYTSSYAVYGNGLHGFDDSMDLKYLQSLRPMSGYGWTKLLFDTHVARAASLNKTSVPQWVGLRLFNVYGPNEYHKGEQQSVISKIAEHAIAAGTVRLFRSYNSNYPDGGQKRDVIYVKDVVRVMLWCLDNPKATGLFNLGSGKASTFNDMATAIFAAINHEPHIHYIDMPEALAPNYQYFTEASMKRLRAAGFADEFISVDTGIRDYVQHYLQQTDRYL